MGGGGESRILHLREVITTGGAFGQVRDKQRGAELRRR